jgi:hypothetical protein
MRDPRYLVALAGALALTACIPKPMESTSAAPAGRGACDADKAYPLIGEIRSEELGARALTQTGARVLRWITPGTSVTMDLREDRLNIDLDTQGRIVGFRCG